jgi:hypothetical protein
MITGRAPRLEWWQCLVAVVPTFPQRARVCTHGVCRPKMPRTGLHIDSPMGNAFVCRHGLLHCPCRRQSWAVLIFSSDVILVAVSVHVSHLERAFLEMDIVVLEPKPGHRACCSFSTAVGGAFRFAYHPSLFSLHRYKDEVHHLSFPIHQDTYSIRSKM